MLRLVPQIGIDLGTANLLVFRRGKGIVLNEPTVVAINSKTKRVLAVGNDAREMLGRTPGNITAIRPMRDGVIAEYTVTEKMLEYIRKKTVPGPGFVKPVALICVPSGVTNVERRAVLKAAQAAGFSRASTIEEPMAAAIGAGLPIAQPGGNMVVDIGGGTTDIAVISLGGIVRSASLRVGGNKMDEAIIRHIRNVYNLGIGEPTAEELKIRIGSAFPMDPELQMEVRGRDMVAGLPKTVEVSSVEIREALSEPVRAIAEKLCQVLEETPPELSSDVIERGIVLTGGGALLRGLSTLLEKMTQIPVRVADNALDCVAIGTGRALEHMDDIERSGAVTRI
ncbi:MAG: rod shape-determining protein [Armatimonadetes bacterium]|nr:rod shape-determining protein [Armatimonadota bacterium]MBS1712396.1 rod shape-determining protein [Armatimonadota bacterium]MBX3109295.1 rod shape-determining protein [Fimbriimonadaceae bacterium]